MAIKKRSATVVPGTSGAAAAIKNPQASKSSFWGELPQHVMSGISRMVPTLIMGGVILAFSQLIAYTWLKIPADIGIFAADPFRYFCHAGNVLRHYAVWRLDQWGYPYHPDCRW